MAEASIMHEGVMGTTEGEQWRTSRQSRWKAACKSRACCHAHIPWKWGISNASSRPVPTDPFETAVNLRERFRKRGAACFFGPKGKESVSGSGGKPCTTRGAADFSIRSVYRGKSGAFYSVGKRRSTPLASNLQTALKAGFHRGFIASGFRQSAGRALSIVSENRRCLP